MAKKKTCIKETRKKLLIMASSDEHRITRPHTLHASLIQPKFSIYNHQSLHVATPIYMLGTPQREQPPWWRNPLVVPSTICSIGEPLHFRRKRALASSLASEGLWRLSNSPRNVEIWLNQITIKLSISGVRLPEKVSLHLDTHTCQTIRPTCFIFHFSFSCACSTWLLAHIYIYVCVVQPCVRA